MPQPTAKAIYLFAKLSPLKHYFQGKFALTDYNYEDELNEEGDARKEYNSDLGRLPIRQIKGGDENG